MGSCIPSKFRKKKITILNSDQISRYPRQGKVMIKSKSSNGRMVGHSTYNFTVTEPTKVISKSIEFMSSKYWISSCVIPGLDPRGEYSKPCQDNCIYLCNGTSILIGVFDGHGQDGDKISDFCCKFVENYYKEKILLFEVKNT